VISEVTEAIREPASFSFEELYQLFQWHCIVALYRTPVQLQNTFNISLTVYHRHKYIDCMYEMYCNLAHELNGTGMKTKYI
jgi:hypothetical protein